MPILGTVNDPVHIAGNFKDLYKSSGLVDLIPNWMIVQDRVPFEEAEAGLGNFYVFGVILQREHGFTYAPTGSADARSGAVQLTEANSGFIGQARVEGFAIYLRSRISYDACSKASRAGRKAFAQAYGAVLKNMKESHQYRLELSLLYGRSGLGAIEAVAGQVITIREDSWATGIWTSGMSNVELEIWSTRDLVATKRNTFVTLGNVNAATRELTVVGALGGVVGAVPPLAEADIIYFRGARFVAAGDGLYNECPGLYSIMSNTGGVLFGINATTYPLWKGQQVAAVGNISLTAIMNAAATGMSFGLNKAFLLINPSAFAQLASDEAALRRYVQDTPNAKRGVKGITFQLGSVDVEILPHPLIWRGIAMMLPEGKVHRVGSTDVTFSLPGSDEKMQLHIHDYTAVEFRSMSDQGIYIDAPAQAVLMTGLT